MVVAVDVVGDLFLSRPVPREFPRDLQFVGLATQRPLRDLQPPMKTRRLSQTLDQFTGSCHHRNVIERRFAPLKQWRGVATRYDKLATVYRAAAVLNAVLAWTRLYQTCSSFRAGHLHRWPCGRRPHLLMDYRRRSTASPSNLVCSKWGHQWRRQQG